MEVGSYVSGEKKEKKKEKERDSGLIGYLKGQQRRGNKVQPGN